MKRPSVMIALGHIGCALLLLASRASGIATSQDDWNNARSEERMKDGQTDHKSKKMSKEHLTDHSRERDKRDHYSSKGERDALIGTGAAVAIKALGEFNKPRQVVSGGVPVATEKPLKTAKHATKRDKMSTARETWSKIDPLKKESVGFPEQSNGSPSPPLLDNKTENKAGPTRTAEEQAILDRKYTAASKRLNEARDEYARSLRVYDPEIATMEDSLAGWNEDDPGTGEDDGPAEAQKEQLYEGYLHRLAESEKAWLNTPRGKVVADIYNDAKEEIRRLNNEDGLTMPKPGEPDPADREEIH